MIREPSSALVVGLPCALRTLLAVAIATVFTLSGAFASPTQTAGASPPQTPSPASSSAQSTLAPSPGGTTGAVPQSNALAPTGGNCELHIWPAATTHTTFQGWFRAGAVDGARRGIKGYPNLRADSLDATQQERLIATIDWQHLAGDPALSVIIHPARSSGDDERARTNRLIANSPACYSEIIILSSFVEAATFSTRSVRILAIRKRFGSITASTSNFASMATADISLPENTKEGDPIIDAATQQAFVAAVRKFAVMQSFH